MLNSKNGFPFWKGFFFFSLSLLSYIFFDRPLLFLIEKHPFPALKFASFLIYPPLHLLLWLGLFLLVHLKQNQWQRPFFAIIVSQFICLTFARISKFLVGRARPEVFLQKGLYGFYGLQWDNHYHSFPSGHTLTAFALSCSLASIFPRFRLLFYLLATFLSLSRPLLLKHYLSDVIATAPIGIIISHFVHITIKEKRYEAV